MKRCMLLIILAFSITFAFCQEGINYRTTRKCMEKTYEVSQKFGKNKMKLATIAKIEYDTTGFIVQKTMTKGNLNYAGKTVVNRSKEPNTWEILNYNYMNNLQDRWVKIVETDPREYTEIQYSSKGKILFKTNVRVDSLRQHQWELVYNELGYIPSYYEVEPDTSRLVAKKIRYDYGENPIESTMYFYNENKLPLLAMTYSTGDTLIGKSICQYDTLNNMTKQTTFNKSGQETDIEEWFYDEKGRIVMHNYSFCDIKFGGVPKLRRTQVYEYE